MLMAYRHAGTRETAARGRGTAERGPEKVKRGRRWASAKAERGHRWNGGKRLAVLNFYPYRTRISSHNLPLATVYIKYATQMPNICIYNYKTRMLNGLLVGVYAMHMLSIYR